MIIYHCISTYPVEDEDLYLKEIVRLNKDYKDIVKAIGFSGHHKGISADIAALAYGAKYFERHFTLDRTWKGTDHAASLEPDGLRRLNRDLKKISKALKFKKEEIIDIEKEQRTKLKFKSEKINIGAGNLWKSDGWETLDNAPTSYPNKWQHYGKCWDTKLNSNFYDIVFTSHTLEHVPQFRVERTISEINRIMKVGGTLRILVPDLEASAKAYLKKDKKIF